MADAIHSTAGGHHSTPSSHTDALDALDDGANILALIGDLLCCTRDGDVVLSQSGATGLYNLIGEYRRISIPALQEVRAYIRNAQKEKVVAEDAHRQGYIRGYADAANEKAPYSNPDNRFLEGVSRGARVAYIAGWRDAGGDAGAIPRDWQADSVTAIVEGYAEDLSGKIDTTALPGDEVPTPVLTEAVPEAAASGERRRRV